jgi:hypothetical protein
MKMKFRASQDIGRRNLLRGAGLCATALALGARAKGAQSLEAGDHWPVESARTWYAGTPGRFDYFLRRLRGINASTRRPKRGP